MFEPLWVDIVIMVVATAATVIISRVLTDRRMENYRKALWGDCTCWFEHGGPDSLPHWRIMPDCPNHGDGDGQEDLIS